MLHWNSFWVHNGPDGKPEPGPTPALDQPWPLEQLTAFHTRNWEHVVAASQAWWSFTTTAWSMPGWVLTNWSHTLSNTAGDARAGAAAPAEVAPGADAQDDTSSPQPHRTPPRRASAKRPAG